MSKIEWTDALRERFWGYVDCAGAGCWVWSAGKFSQGYGQFRAGKRKVKAHRAAYELVHGPIPDDLIVRHRCDNPPCCNPEHLVLGTHKDNSADRDTRGRSNPRWGARNPSAKLSTSDVALIRQLATEGRTYRDIGAAFSIHYNHVGRIVRGERRANG